MPHGAPDWYKYREDRTRGKTFWTEDFLTGLNAWDASPSGLGSTITTSYEQALSPGYSCKMITGTTLGMSATIATYRPRARAGSYGLEVSFTLRPHHTYFYIRLESYDGTSLYGFQLRYNPATSRLQYRDALAAWINFDPAIPLSTITGLFHTMKVVADLTAHTYHRAQLDDLTFDLRNALAFRSPNGAVAHIMLEIQYVGCATDNETGYVDDVTLSQDEP